MYINSSRLLPVHSRAKSNNNIHTQRNKGGSNKNNCRNSSRNDGKNMERAERKSNGKKIAINDDIIIPQMQILPNGQKPNFGNQSVNKNFDSHNESKKHSKKNKKNHNTHGIT